MRISALILDYGEVLSAPQPAESLEAMAGVLGVDVGPFIDAYWLLRHEYDLDMPAHEYWTRTALALGCPEPDEAQITALVACDIDSWTEYSEEMWALAAEFRMRGGRTAFLSNGVPEIMERIRTDHPLEDLFDAVVVSCEVGLAKPDPAIFRLTLRLLGVTAHEALLVDDRVANTDAARALGLQTITYSRAHTVNDIRRALAL